MTAEETLREIVSTLGKVDREQLTPETRLAGALSSSFGRARLDANVRSKLGLNNPGIYSVATFGELCALLGVKPSVSGAAQPEPAAPASAAAPSIEAPGAGNGIGIGVDVELVRSMPDVADYWEDDFYKMTFTRREIAYALLQSSPRASFAAMWCAKEAVHKIDASLARLDWQRLEVVHDANGKPGIAVDGQRLAGALSLSHTDEIAFAVFVVAPRPEPVASASPAPPRPPAADLQGHNSRIPAITAAFALLVSIVALALSLVRP